MPRLELHGVFDNLVAPVAVTSLPGDTLHLYVAEQTGEIYRMPLPGTAGAPLLALDLRDVLLIPDPHYDESGLLCVAFPPGFADPGSSQLGRAYVTYSARPDAPGAVPEQPAGPLFFPRMGIEEGAEPAYYNRLSRFTVLPDGRFDRASEEILLQVPHYDLMHNGCRIGFSPAEPDYLYLTLGDGGPQGDPHGIGQNPLALEGKILRLDVSQRSGPFGRRYGIPPTNPFVNVRGTHPEIYAIGFRNPWGISWDETGRCFVADCGYHTIESLYILVPGGNFGWSVKEGSQFTPWSTREQRQQLYMDPIWEWSHMQADAPEGSREDVFGECIIGGETPWAGAYIGGDWIGKLYLLQSDDQGHWHLIAKQVYDDFFIRAFGRDAAGNIYIVSTVNVGPSGRTGAVWRVTVAPE